MSLVRRSLLEPEVPPSCSRKTRNVIEHKGGAWLQEHSILCHQPQDRSVHLGICLSSHRLSALMLVRTLEGGGAIISTWYLHILTILQ